MPKLGVSREWRVSDQQLTHSCAAAESILHDAAEVKEAVVLAAADVGISLVKQEDRERHQQPGATAKVISMLPEYHFDWLLMDKMESVEVRQELQGKPLISDDLLARYVKFTIKAARNINPLRAAINWCLVLCGGFTAEQTLALLAHAAPGFIEQQFPEQECSRLRRKLLGHELHKDHKLLGGVRWRFAGMLPQEHGTLVVAFRRPSSHEVDVVNHCLERFLPWGIDHVIPCGYKAGDSLSSFAQNVMKTMHLFSCPLCFSRLSCAWNLGAFEDHVRIPYLNPPQVRMDSFQLKEIRESIRRKQGRQ